MYDDLVEGKVHAEVAVYESTVHVYYSITYRSRQHCTYAFIIPLLLSIDLQWEVCLSLLDKRIQLLGDITVTSYKING
jgi:hypothetical protein